MGTELPKAVMHGTEISMPNRQDKIFARYESNYLRFNCLHSITSPCSSTPWSKKTFFAKLMPNTVILSMSAASQVLIETTLYRHFGHFDAGLEEAVFMPSD